MATYNTTHPDIHIDWRREEQILRLRYNYLLARLRMAIYWCCKLGAPAHFQQGLTGELVS